MDNIMRFLYCELTGYIGIFNGLGLEKITINFSKCKHLICLIGGPNGVGKSTIINALHILPDANTCFITGKDASKIIVLRYGDIIYKISIFSKWANHKRTNEAYISKNGVELNPNGNISSYKDTVFSEFDIDPNYIAMTKISSEDRGIADKTPAERKKIIASRIASLDIYNEMYKVLNKKANIFKSHLNSISSKLQNIGNRNSLELRLGEISKSEYALVDEIEGLKKTITSAEVQIQMLDPNNDAFQKYKSEVKELEDFIASLEEREETFNNLVRRAFPPSAVRGSRQKYEYKKSAEEKMNQVTDAGKSISVYEGAQTVYIGTLERITRQIDDLKAKLEQESKSEDNIDNSKLQTLTLAKEQKMAEYDIITADNLCNPYFSSLKSKDLQAIEQALHIIPLLEEKYSEIQRTEGYNNTEVYAELDRSIVGENSWSAAQFYLKTNLDQAISNKEEQKEDLSQIQNKLRMAEMELEKICEMLQSGESSIDKCKNHDCVYYKDMVKNKERKDELECYIKELNIRVTHLNDFSELDKSIMIYNLAITLLAEMKRLNEILSIGYQALSLVYKIDISDRPSAYFDLSVITEIIESKKDLVDAYNAISDQNRLSTAIAAIDSTLARNHAIINMVEQLESLEIEKEDIKKKLTATLKERDTEKAIYQQRQKELDILQTADKIWEELKKLRDRKHELEKSINTYQETGEKLAKLADSIIIAEEASNKAMDRLKEVSDEKKHIESQLTIWDNFQQEYTEYKEKYDYVNILRKYCSPTQGGIQSIYMSIYMNKTLDMANQLLGMLFNGQYQLLEYVINEQEFRIPFIGGGLVVDDISSGSTSQKCTMGSIISLVTTSSSSSIYRIASLDETDSGLDQANRMIYTDFILKACDILKINQLFTISHSIESTLSNVDVILLSDEPEYKDRFTNANIIYQYERSI